MTLEEALRRLNTAEGILKEACEAAGFGGSARWEELPSAIEAFRENIATLETDAALDQLTIEKGQADHAAAKKRSQDFGEHVYELIESSKRMRILYDLQVEVNERLESYATHKANCSKWEPFTFFNLTNQPCDCGFEQ